MDVAPYAMATSYQVERRRPRKLLMKRREIDALRRKGEERGFSLIPTKLYFRNGRVKVEVSVGRGKKSYDKRESIAKKDERREMERKER
jgi:SsrA-binding protein